MKRLILLVFLSLAPMQAFACPAAPPSPEANRMPDPARLDQGILTNAVLSQVNALRCAKGLSPLAATPGLITVAATHSQWMASNGSLSHVSGVAGQKTLADRLRRARTGHSRGAENVGYVSGCNRTYLQIAHAMVGWWNESSGHRTNMLTGAFARAGAGIAFAGGCNRAYLTLDMVN